MSLITVHINRLHDDGTETLGRLYVYEGFNRIFECCTLELPWENNLRNHSCIPSGKYPCHLTYSPKFGKNMYEILNVPNRAGIRIHKANYFDQLSGCIAVGSDFKDTNNDGFLDVIESRITEEKLMSILPSKFQITIA